MAKIGIIGAGTWGTALAVLLNNNGHEVTIWSIIPEEVEMLRTKRQHEKKLPGVILAPNIDVTGDLEDAMTDKDILVLAVPSPFTRSTAHSMRAFCKEGQKIVDVAKGVEEKTLMTLSQIIEEEIPQADVAVLSGPSHAEEVGKCIPTTCVVGAHSRETAEYLQNIFMSKVFPECFQAVLQIFCFYFAFVLRNCDHFMAAVLNGSRLMAGYMAGLCCDHALIRFQHGADHNGICLRTARQEINICLWTFARLPDFLFCTFTVWIRSVSGYFLQICFHKSLKDLFMCSFRIIIFK